MFDSKKAALLIIDVQGKLAASVFEKEKVCKNIQTLIKAAKILRIPILWTEQVPEKIGNTIPEIATWLRPLQPISKASFSCCGEKKFRDDLVDLKRRQIVITGIETHVCVYQTVADLVELKYAVQVVADAVSSRSADNKQYGLERIKEVGGQITCAEMIICELLQRAEGEKFKAILHLIK